MTVAAKMKIKQFKPGLVPTLIFLLLFPILLRLGFWQLDRADEKRHIQLLFEQRAQLSALEVKSDLAISNDLKYRRVVVSGTYDVNHQILLDNKVYKQTVGYHVLTPLKIKNSNLAILVNRGWVKGSLDRRILPEISTPVQSVKINGVFSLPGSNYFTDSEYNRDGDNWPAVYQRVDYQDIEKATGLSLIPVIILQDPNDAHGYVRAWSKVNLKPEKSTSYAVQWFSLAFALLVIYIVVNLKKVERTSNEQS